MIRSLAAGSLDCGRGVVATGAGSLGLAGQPSGSGEAAAAVEWVKSSFGRLGGR